MPVQIKTMLHKLGTHGHIKTGAASTHAHVHTDKENHTLIAKLMVGFASHFTGVSVLFSVCVCG